jgi:hypothetical protein
MDDDKEWISIFMDILNQYAVQVRRIQGFKWFTYVFDWSFRK